VQSWVVTTRCLKGQNDSEITDGPPAFGPALSRQDLLELLASGMSIEDIIEDHPDLERDDLLAALEFGALASGQRRVVPLGAT
jgi:uncharacterized protein (DUF433 family)